MMTSLQAPNQVRVQPTYSKRYLQNVRAVNGLAPQTENKWTYLLSSRIKFASPIPYAVQLNKPADEQLYIWLERIITGGQCGLLFVEELDLSDARSQKIKRLCEHQGITLVNLTLEHPLPDNLLVGPWH